MKEMTMLGLDRVDLDELCAALEDNSPEHEQLLDPLTGELEFRLRTWTSPASVTCGALGPHSGPRSVPCRR